MSSGIDPTSRASARPSAVTLIGRIFSGFVSLAGDEVALAATELKGKAIGLAIAAAMLFGIALLSVAILATLTACLILAFAQIVAPWLAALIVCGIYVLVALVLALIARANLVRAMPPIPKKALASIKENVRWAKRLTTSTKI